MRKKKKKKKNLPVAVVAGAAGANKGLLNNFFLLFFFFYFFLTDFSIFFTNSLSFSIFLDKTWNIFPAPAPNCLCPAGPTSLSDTLLSNRTSPNILPLCKVRFPGSLHPLCVCILWDICISLKVFAGQC